MLQTLAAHNIFRSRLFRCGVMLLALATAVSGASMALAVGPGAMIYLELKEKGQLYPDEKLQTYITDIGERLLATTPHKGKTYVFTLVDDPSVNASATEDAYVFVYRGLLAHLRSEDELAAVIGHEIGHVVGRHGSEARTRGLLAEVGGWLAGLATGTSAMWDLSKTVGSTLQSGYGRENELESDRYSAQWLAQAGYYPPAMIATIQALKDHQLYQRSVSGGRATYHGLFSTHPRSDKRLHDLVDQALPLMSEVAAEPIGDFWKMIDGLSFGDEAATGLIKKGSYYHGSLRVVITFPQDWNVTNTATEVSAVAPPKSNGDAFITVQRQNPPADKEQSPEDYVTETLKRDDTENGELTEINGYAAYVADIKIAAGNAQKRKIAIVYKDNDVYMFRGEVGPKGRVEQFETWFAETVGSIRAMTQDDLRVANSQQIRVVEAKPGDTYAELAKTISIKANGEEILRVINGHHPNGEPRAGDLIKLIE